VISALGFSDASLNYSELQVESFGVPLLSKPITNQTGGSERHNGAERSFVLLK